MKWSRASLLCSFHCLFLGIALVELLDAPAGLDIALTSREERMALGADIDAKLLLRGACRELVAAAAGDGRLVKFRMDTFLHS